MSDVPGGLKRGWRNAASVLAAAPIATVLSQHLAERALSLTALGSDAGFAAAQKSGSLS
jgi:hypothetical protein